MTGLTLFIIWLVGSIVFYLADGWFGFSDSFQFKEDIVFASIFWIVYVPIKLLMGVNRYLRKIKRNIRNKRQQREKIRIAEQKELASYEEEIERELKINQAR
jgi:hypothetical protein